jgi:hypothetical protein
LKKLKPMHPLPALRRALRGIGPVGLLFWAGCVLMTAGVTLWWGSPAGLLSGGALCLLGSFLSDGNGGGAG